MEPLIITFLILVLHISAFIAVPLLCPPSGTASTCRDAAVVAQEKCALKKYYPAD